MSEGSSVEPVRSGAGIREPSSPSGASNAKGTKTGFALLRCAAPFIAAGFLSLTFSTFPHPPVDLGGDADTSLAAVLGFARAHNLQFGHDIVMTYGASGKDVVVGGDDEHASAKSAASASTGTGTGGRITFP